MEASQASDKAVLPINPHLELNNTIIIAQKRRFCTHT